MSKLVLLLLPLIAPSILIRTPIIVIIVFEIVGMGSFRRIAANILEVTTIAILLLIIVVDYASHHWI